MKSYITPEKIIQIVFKDNIPKVPELVFIIFQKSLFKRIEKQTLLEKVKFIRGDFYIEKNKKFGIITNFGKGESEALMLAEELSSLGVKKVISFGIAGGLSRKLNIGDILIVEEAFSQLNIGSIYDYKKREVFTSKIQNKKIEEVLEKETITFDFVKTLSVPTIYRETKEEIENAKDKDISIIEMEIFSLALVFFLKKVEFSAICCVSDILDSDGWKFTSDFSEVFQSLENTFTKIQKI